jgi:hypothetical protein
MALKKINITKSTYITANGKDITREQVIKLSEDWSDVQQGIFKKLVRQGGRVTIKKVDFICTPLSKITNSQNQKDGGTPKMFGPEN